MKRLLRTIEANHGKYFDTERDVSVRPIKVISDALSHLEILDNGSEIIVANAILCAIYTHKNYLILHHINYDNTNNTPSNISIMSRSAHTKLHSEKLHKRMLVYFQNNSIHYHMSTREYQKEVDMMNKMFGGPIGYSGNTVDLSPSRLDNQLNNWLTSIQALSQKTQITDIIRKYNKTTLRKLCELARRNVYNNNLSRDIQYNENKSGASFEYDNSDLSLIESEFISFSKAIKPNLTYVSGNDIDKFSDMVDMHVDNHGIDPPITDSERRETIKWLVKMKPKYEANKKLMKGIDLIIDSLSSLEYDRRIKNEKGN